MIAFALCTDENAFSQLGKGKPIQIDKKVNLIHTLDVKFQIC